METLRAIDVAALRELVWLPLDYLEWVRNYGFGDVGEGLGVYFIYSAPLQLNEVCPDAPSDLWTFGDDFSGYSGCFVEGGNGTVLEWDSAASTLSDTGQRFPEFIAKWRQ